MKTLRPQETPVSTPCVTFGVGFLISCPNTNFVPISYAVQMYSSLRPIENAIEAANLVLLIIHLIVLLLSQRLFMRSIVITGMENKAK